LFVVVHAARLQGYEQASRLHHEIETLPDNTRTLTNPTPDLRFFLTSLSVGRRACVHPRDGNQTPNPEVRS
jgi:hypothetical protein